MPRLGPFELEAPLGRGAMGVVWAARHAPTGVRAAVKMAAGALSSERRRDADVEARAVAALSHPGVIRLYDRGDVPEAVAGTLGVQVGAPWLAMELARGALDGAGCGGAEAHARLSQILAALAHAHARGVLHLDLKPANLLVADDGALLLADFGIARILGAPPLELRVRGSLPTMAPEQLGDTSPHGLGPWTDLYAVGCVAFSWLTGSWPWPALPAGIARQARSREPVRLPRGGEAADWIAWLTEPDPVARPACAAHAAAALAGIALPDAPEAAAPPPATFDTGTLVEPGRAEAPRIRAAAPPAVPRRRRTGHATDAVDARLLPFRRWPLVGREEVLAALRSELAEVTRTRVPRLIGLTGAIGMGRTAALRAFLEELVESGLGGALGAFDHVDRERLDLIRIDAGLPTDIVACAGRRTLALGLDDVSDRPGWQRALPSLLAQPDLPLLIVVTARPEARDAVSGVERWLELEPLPDAALAALVDSLVALAPEVAGRLVARAAGCPLYAVRTLEAWVSADVLTSGPSGLALRDPEPPLAPDLASAVRAPLASALRDAEAAVGALALLTPPVDRALWAAVAPGADDALADHLIALGVLRDAGGLAFTSAATREVVRGGLPPTLAQHLHARAHDALPVDAPAADRGRHALGAGRLDEARAPLEEAVMELLVAGDLRGATLVAADLAAALHAVPDDDPRRTRQLVAAAQLAHLQGRSADALEAARRAALVADDPILAARARQLGAAAAQRAGDLRGALGLLAQAERGFGEAGQGSRLVECLASAEEIYTALGEEEAADRALSQALARLERADDAVAGITLARQGQRLVSRGRPEEALVALDRADARLALAERPLLRAIASTYRAAAHQALGDLDAARRELEDARARMEAAGSADAHVVHLALLRLELDADRPGVVLASADALIRRFARLGRRPHETSARALRCWARARLGDHDGLEGELTALVHAVHDAGPAPWQLRAVLSHLVEALAARPDLAEIARRGLTT